MGSLIRNVELHSARTAASLRRYPPIIASKAGCRSMSRDQKPGKVRHVGAVQERRQSDAAAQPNAGAGAANGGAAEATAAGSAAADAATPAAKGGGMGMIAIVLFLVFAGVGGGGIVALAPVLGLWP
jgi:hypothetical protein